MQKDNKSKVIIIGNSFVVLEKEYGSLIDSYDIVIRINRCVTKGYEKYVGSKTDIWVTSSWCLKSSPDKAKSESGNLGLPYFMPDNFENLKSIWYRTPGDINKPSDMVRWKNLLKKVPNSYTMWKTKEFTNNFRKYMDKGGINMKSSGVDPDTGLLAILTSTLFYEDVTIHGFTFYTDSSGAIIKNSKEVWYYQQSESDEDGKHPEDIAWKRVRFKTNFLSVGATRERKDIVNELVENGDVKWLKK